MSQATAVTERDINGFILSITTRRREGDSPQTLQDLTTNTLNAWLWMVNLLQKKEWDTAVDLPSVEEKYGTEKGINMEETFGEPRVTIWATWRSTNKFRFHLNSDDRLQNAVMVHAAQEAGIEASIAAWNKAHPSTSQPPEAPATQKNAPQQPQAPNTPTAPQNAGNANVGGFYTKKDAIAKLQPSDKFKMKIVQIEKHSKDGKDFYEFFEPYGGKAGQYSAASVFTDNEVALNNGLIAYLDTLGVKLGQALTGEWVVNCAVGKPKTKMFKGVEQTFTNIYINSFEGQPSLKPPKFSSEYAYDGDLDSEFDVM